MKRCVGEKTEMAIAVLSLRSSGLSQDEKSHRGVKTQKGYRICWHGMEGKEPKEGLWPTWRHLTSTQLCKVTIKVQRSPHPRPQLCPQREEVLLFVRMRR